MGAEAVILYIKYLYKTRNRTEGFFNKLKQFPQRMSIQPSTSAQRF